MKQGLDLGELAPEHCGDDFELVAHVPGVGLGEDRADRGDHLSGALGDLGEHVANEVHPAALHRGAGEHGLHRGPQTEVGVGND